MGDDTHRDHDGEKGPLATGVVPVPSAFPAPDGVTLFRVALLGQTPRVWVTPMLVGLNVAVFALMVATGVSVLGPKTQDLIRWGADYAPRTTAGEWWRLITNTFVHVGAIHIAMNMIGLWQIGALVERLLGHRSFLLVYLFSGLAGSLASITWHPYVVSAGASGAVFGVYGVLAAYLVRHRGSIPRAVLLQLQKSTLFFIGFNVLFGLQQKGIDMAAHLGGLGGGFAAALLVARPLSGRPAQGSWRRDLLLAVIGLLLVAAAVRLMPRALDLQKEMADFQTVEQRAVDAYNGALEQRRVGRLSDSTLADAIEKQVLPPWRTYQDHLARLGHLPPSEGGYIDKIRRYMDLRERGWTALGRALRTHDQTKADESRRWQDQAEALMKGLPEK